MALKGRTNSLRNESPAELDPVPSHARYHPLVRDALALPSKIAMALAVLGVAVVIRVVQRERTRRRERRRREPAPLIER